MTALSPSLLRLERDWLWLDKPAGLPVFPPHRDPGGDSLLRWLLAERPELAELPFPEGFAGGLAHRLDTSTSGVVLAARSPEALARARACFANKRLLKTYQLLSAGQPPWRENTLTAPLAHHPRRRDRMVAQRGQSTPHRGRWLPAETRFEALAPGRWQVQMRSGVMHQIRVHAAFAGLAILGDRRYGGAPMPEGLAPAGTTFALHHVGMSGLSGPGGLGDADAPSLPPPRWWSDWSIAT